MTLTAAVVMLVWCQVSGVILAWVLDRPILDLVTDTLFEKVEGQDLRSSSYGALLR